MGLCRDESRQRHAVVDGQVSLTFCSLTGRVGDVCTLSSSTNAYETRSSLLEALA